MINVGVHILVFRISSFLHLSTALILAYISLACMSLPVCICVRTCVVCLSCVVSQHTQYYSMLYMLRMYVCMYLYGTYYFSFSFIIVSQQQHQLILFLTVRIVPTLQTTYSYIYCLFIRYPGPGHKQYSFLSFCICPAVVLTSVSTLCYRYHVIDFVTPEVQQFCVSQRSTV